MEKLLKKVFALLLVLLVAISLAGCNNNSQGGGQEGGEGDGGAGHEAGVLQCRVGEERVEPLPGADPKRR